MRPFSSLTSLSNARGMGSIFTLLLPILCSLAVAQSSYPVPWIANPLVPMTVAPGSAAFTLTVNGTGFVSGSTVYWNGSARTTTLVSSSQLTATINTSDVTTATSGAVTVHGPSGAVSNTALLLVTTSAPSLAFGALEINGFGGDVLAADFNGDGNADIVVNSGLYVVAGAFMIETGNGDGSLQAPVQYYLPSGTTVTGRGTALGDFNNDGLVDIAIAGYTPAAEQVFLNSGNAVFQTPFQTALSKIPEDTATADLNGDGKLDLIFTASGSVGVALGNGDGTFQAPMYFPLPNDSYSIAIGDFNRDGIPDIATSIFDYGGISVLLGLGDGTFAPQVNYDNGQQTYYLISADLNGDGYPDLIGPDINVNTFYVLLNNGDGSFSPSVANHGPDPYAYLLGTVAADMNGDGKLDIVLSNTDDCVVNCTTIFPGNGDGTFQPASQFGIRQDRAGSDSGKGAVGDFNHDGKLDIATETSNGPYLMIQTAGPAPTIAPGNLSFAPQTVGTTSPGQTVQMFQPGSTDITINSVTVTGDFATTFNSSCVLYPGNSSPCNFTVTFTPTATGTRTGSAIVNSTGSTQYMAFVGTGLGTTVAISITPSALTYPTQVLNSTSAYQNVTITNTGNALLNLDSITLAGTDPKDFILSNACPISLGVGLSCTVQVAFQPTRRGSRTASLSIADNAPGSPQTVTLSGTGTANSLSASSINFGAVAVGSSSSQNLTLTNVGGQATLIGQVKITGINKKDYSQTNTCGTSVAPKASCTFTVTFSPGFKGSRIANLQFTSSGTGTNAITTVPLTGTGK
jgi:hypothetical protein